MRVVIDANVWVSAILNDEGVSAHVLDALTDGLFTPVSSRQMLSELHTVLLRNKIARQASLTPADVKATVDYFKDCSELFEVTGDYRLCSDPEDDKVIETAIRGKASVIVSSDGHLHDPDLQPLLAFHDITVMYPGDFINAIRQEV